jgi:hypothetical protein
MSARLRHPTLQTHHIDCGSGRSTNEKDYPRTVPGTRQELFDQARVTYQYDENESSGTPSVDETLIRAVGHVAFTNVFNPERVARGREVN